MADATKRKKNYITSVCVCECVFAQNIGYFNTADNRISVDLVYLYLAFMGKIILICMRQLIPSRD